MSGRVEKCIVYGRSRCWTFLRLALTFCVCLCLRGAVACAYAGQRVIVFFILSHCHYMLQYSQVQYIPFRVNQNHTGSSYVILDAIQISTTLTCTLCSNYVLRFMSLIRKSIRVYV